MPQSRARQEASPRRGPTRGAGDRPYLRPGGGGGGGCGSCGGVAAPMASPASGGRAGKHQRLSAARSPPRSQRPPRRGHWAGASRGAAGGRASPARVTLYLRAPSRAGGPPASRPPEPDWPSPGALGLGAGTAGSRAHRPPRPGNVLVPTFLSCWRERGASYDSGRQWGDPEMRPLANRSVPLTPYFCVWGSSLFRFDPVCALSRAGTIRAAGLRHSADATVT